MELNISVHLPLGPLACFILVIANISKLHFNSGKMNGQVTNTAQQVEQRPKALNQFNDSFQDFKTNLIQSFDILYSQISLQLNEMQSKINEETSLLSQQQPENASIVSNQNESTIYNIQHTSCTTSTNTTLFVRCTY